MSAESTNSKSAMSRFGPLAVLVLLAQLGIAWVLIQALLTPDGPKAPAGDVMMTQALMGQVEQDTDAEDDADLPHYFSPPQLARVAVNPAGTGGERVMVASLVLGIRAYDRSESPPKEITAKIMSEMELLLTLDRYASRARSIVSSILSRQTIEDMGAPGGLKRIGDEIRDTVNQEVLRPAFPPATADKYAVIVEVLFSGLVIQ